MHSAQQKINKINPRITQENSREFILNLYASLKENTRNNTQTILTSTQQTNQETPGHLIQEKLHILDDIFASYHFKKLPISKNNIHYYLADGVITLCYPEMMEFQPSLSTMHVEMFFMRDNGLMSKITPKDSKERFYNQNGLVLPLKTIEHTIGQPLLAHITHLYSKGQHTDIPDTEESYALWQSHIPYRPLFEFSWHVRKHAIENSQELGTLMSKRNLFQYLDNIGCTPILSGQGLVAVKKTLTSTSYMEIDIFYDTTVENSNRKLGFREVTAALRYFSPAHPEGVAGKNRLACLVLQQPELHSIFFDIPGPTLDKILTTWWNAWEPNQ